MAEKELEAQEIEASEPLSTAPRFFTELNEPILVWGLNLEGIGLPVLISAVWFGLGLWLAFFGTLFLGVWLCRVMAKNPTIIQELRARFERAQMVVSHDDSYAPLVRVVTPNGVVRSTEWAMNRRLATKTREF